MARLALRQFLRSSFDLGDKTMASPIIACLGAATLLLASCCFTSITANSFVDYPWDPPPIEPRIQPLEPSPPPPGATGFVRVSNISAPIRAAASTRKPSSGARSLHGRPRLQNLPKRQYENERQHPDRVNFERETKSMMDAYLRLLGKHVMLIIDIAAKEIDTGITNIAQYVEEHENGRINVRAETKVGRAVGQWALKYLRQFFKDRWVGVLAHMAQEAADRFISGSQRFFAKTENVNFFRETRGESETEDYTDVSVTAATLQIDMAEDFDQYEINEYEDPVGKTYHCSVQSQNKNDTLQPNLEMIKFLDDNGPAAVRPKKNYYQVRQIRQRMCQFGFNPFAVDTAAGSIHKRFKNTLRLMIYNTPGMFPGLKVIRNDLDRKRKREPQIWFRFETSSGPLISEFDYDNYFVTVSGDFARIQAYSKMLVALKMHKRLNSFKDLVSYKINLDLGIMEVILSSFGMALMREKSATKLVAKALNAVRTEINSSGDVQLEFEESLKDAADQVDPLLYSSIWLLSMAEKYEVVRIRDRSRSIHDKSMTLQESGRMSRAAPR